MPTPRPFLFDIGNVLCTFDFEPMISALEERSTRAGADPISRFAATKDSYESGAFSDEEFVAYVTEEIGFNGERDEFVQLWTHIFEENSAMSSLVKTLAEAGHPLYLLSNTNGLHLEFLLREFPVFAHFLGGTYSHEAKAAKPGERIFEIAFERFSLDPNETYYIDDLSPNVETGRRLGLTTHHYSPDDHAALEHWLADLGITV